MTRLQREYIPIRVVVVCSKSRRSGRLWWWWCRSATGYGVTAASAGRCRAKCGQRHTTRSSGCGVENDPSSAVPPPDVVVVQHLKGLLGCLLWVGTRCCFVIIVMMVDDHFVVPRGPPSSLVDKSILAWWSYNV